jgi:predicted component of type VI protein secretion system
MMFQLQLLSGKQAGFLWETRRFPVRIGRAAGSDLQIEEDGVWDEHARVELKSGDGFVITAHPGALLSVNQSPVETIRLRNGDIITAGSARIAFRLSQTRQRGQKWRESLIWLIIAGITVSQIAMIGWLLR